ncbi:MAG: LytTR family transcriptional regulator [Bacteroidales bacterium]|nr:LytTR family transcriptional regulator [Bacteroidales bacterium]
MKKLKTWLNKPFPFYETDRQKITIPFLFALFIMLFLISFNPSQNKDFVLDQFLKVLAYGSITFIIMILYNTLLPLIFSDVFDSEKWNIQKTIIFTLLSIISIGLINGLFAFKFDNTVNSIDILSFLLSVLLKTFTIGFLPIIFFVFFREKNLYKKNHLKAVEIIEELKKSKNNELNYSKERIIKSDNSNDEIEIESNNLYCIKSEGNYCMLFFNNNNFVEKKMIRSSLNKIEKAYNNSNKIIRCHKSYIINLDKVTDIKGNARGYYFFIDELAFKIPGSRNLAKTLITEIKNN